jgi:iron complex transport system permease protein
MMGSFSAISPASIAGLVVALAVSLIPLVLLRWRIDTLAVADDEAHAMGVSSHRLRLGVVVLAALATSASVAVAGVIGWIGLIVPHLARMLVGAAFARWLPASALLGAVFMLTIDTLGRMMGDTELPPGVLAALLGAPVLFMLMRRGVR